jgi:Predicted esterase
VDIKFQYFKTQRIARVFTNVVKPSNVKKIIFAFHGYGQLANNFISSLTFLDNGNTLIIAPEGLSRFYNSDKIGASWMTSEDRNNEILDYINYLSGVYDEITSIPEMSEPEIVILGFSQGGHTAARFCAHSGKRVNKLLLCSSTFPDDIQQRHLSSSFSNTEIYFISGTNDKISPQSEIYASAQVLKDLNLNFKIINFEGGHQISSEKVLDIIG